MWMKRVFVLLAGVAVGCTADDGGQAVIAPERLEPETVDRLEPDPELDELARLGRCEELDGTRLRECLKRAQYLPEHAAGLPGDPGLTRRLDPEQVDPNPRERVLERQELGRTGRQAADVDPRDETDTERRRPSREQR